MTVPHPPAAFPTPNFLPTVPPPGVGADLSKMSPMEEMHHIIPATIGPLDQLSLRMSPQRQSPLQQPQERRIHSTVDQSSTDQSDDEDIDVVKSAFVPIKPASIMLQETQDPDSTVQDKEPLVKVKSELKAPSSKNLKNISDHSPNRTKILSPPSINASKSVWRPY